MRIFASHINSGCIGMI